MAKGLGHWYVELKKQAYWRGNVHVWTNRYVMSGSDPTAAQMTSVIELLQGIEGKIHPIQPSGHGIGFVEGSAYSSAGGPPVAVVPYNPTLAAATATGFQGPTYTSPSMAQAPTLEVCMLIETTLNGVNSRGKPDYMRKFIRSVSFAAESADSSSPIPANDISGIEAIVAPWTTGIGANNWVVIAPSGKQASQPPVVKPYLVNHQVPRGRKRKKTTTSGGLLGSLENAVQTLGGATAIGEAVGSAL